VAQSIYVGKEEECPPLHIPHAEPSAIYMFEFLQLLIDYNDFSLDFGSMVDKMKLGGAL
jgi:hypothetical protein